MPQGFRPWSSCLARCVEAVRLTSITFNHEGWEEARAETQSRILWRYAAPATTKPTLALNYQKNFYMKSTYSTYHGFSLDTVIGSYYIMRINVSMAGIMLHHYEVYRRKGKDFFLEYQSEEINDDAFNECVNYIRLK